MVAMAAEGGDWLLTLEREALPEPERKQARSGGCQSFALVRTKGEVLTHKRGLAVVKNSELQMLRQANLGHLVVGQWGETGSNPRALKLLL